MGTPLDTSRIVEYYPDIKFEEDRVTKAHLGIDSEDKPSGIACRTEFWLDEGMVFWFDDNGTRRPALCVCGHWHEETGIYFRILGGESGDEPRLMQEPDLEKLAYPMTPEEEAMTRLMLE